MTRTLGWSGAGVPGQEGAVGLRVLVVEDDRSLAEVIARGLRQEALAVDVAVDGAEAIDKSEVTSYDVVVLDRDLPEVHGDDGVRRAVRPGPR